MAETEASSNEVVLSKELQLLKTLKAACKIISIQKYLIWMCDWDQNAKDAMDIMRTAYSDFLNSEGQILLDNYCSMEVLVIALEYAEKWEQITDYAKAQVRKQESQLEVWNWIQ